jgi:hypothetical protein
VGIHKLGIVGSLFALVALASLGCSKNESPAASKPEVKADAVVANSFAVSGTSDLKMKIKKSALDKEFLLMGEMVWLAPTARFRGMKSRIVAFKKIGDQVVMLEATQGHRISTVYPANFILAQFPVLSETDADIVFDFNAGMTNIYNSSEWYASDLDSFDASHVESRYHIERSFIADVKVQQNQLVIRHAAQIADEKGDLQSIEAKYYLAPYNPTAGFKPTVSSGKSQVGFFEVTPQYTDDGTGTPVVLAAKFDLSKPIVFALSANTPVELRPAFTEAILYWNRILGAGRIQVVQLTDAAIVAPDAQYNIVQWLDFSGAGAAYADAQADPRTGEVLHAQVYIPSAFYAGSKASVAIRLRNYLAKQSQTKSVDSRGGVLGLNSLCGDDFEAASVEKVLALALSDITEAEYVNTIQDYIANTVAHEVGHVLGLRHNFAGSLASNYPRSSMREEFATYMANGSVNLKDLRPSSSVMEYSSFEDRAFSGDSIRNAKMAPLLYDQKALGVLYMGNPIDDSIPLFCTDSHSFTDCKKSDMGSSVLEDTIATMNERLDEYPSRFINLLLMEKETSGDMSRVSFSAASNAKLITAFRDQTMAMLTNKTSLLQVRLKTETGAQDLPEIRKSEQAFIEKEIQRLGGMSEVLAMNPEGFADRSNARLESLLKLPQIASTLSHAERDYILKTGRTFFPLLEKELVQEDLKSLALASLKMTDGQLKLTENPALLKELSNVFFSRAEKFALSREGTELESPYTNDAGVTMDLKLANYRFPFAVRNAAVGLLAQDLSARLDFGLVERANLKLALSQDMKPQAGVELKDATNPALTSDARVWILENKKILRALD